MPTFGQGSTSSNLRNSESFGSASISSILRTRDDNRRKRTSLAGRRMSDSAHGVRPAVLFGNLIFENASIEARCARIESTAQRIGLGANFDAEEEVETLCWPKRTHGRRSG